jgi:hypothetical protein
VFAVDGLGKNACAGGLAHAARTAKEVGVCQLAGPDGVQQSSGQSPLAYHHVKRGRTIFAGRNDVLFHIQFVITLHKDTKYSQISVGLTAIIWK